MDYWMLTGVVLSAIFLVKVSSDGQATCPGNADDCLVLAGASVQAANQSNFCTEMPQRVDAASYCLQRCGFTKPQVLQQVLDDLDSYCSGTKGCEQFVSKYDTFRSCYNHTEVLVELVENVIQKHNSRALQMKDCMSLRVVRGCMGRESRGCPHLTAAYDDLGASVRNFDVSLHICGAENVRSPTREGGCDSADDDIRGECDVACELTASKTAGDICTLLQSQATCIYRNGAECTEAQVDHLLPRLQTYSLVNQLFRCNISVDGVVALPSFGLQCDYKRVLENCLGVHLSSDGIQLVDVKKLLNGDILSDHFCQSKYDKGGSARLNCIKSLWSCTNPLVQIYSGKTERQKFDPSLGAFPFSDFGLDLLFSGCSSGKSKPGLACQSPSYDVVLSTPERLFKFTKGVRLHTPRTAART